MIRRRRVRRGASLRAKEGLNCRAQLNRPSKAMLEERTAALEHHLQRKLRPAGQLLAAPLSDQGGQACQPGQDLPHLRNRGVQGSPDLDAILDQVLERLRLPVAGIQAWAPRPGRWGKGQGVGNLIRCGVDSVCQEGRYPGKKLQGSRPSPEPSAGANLGQGAEAVATPAKRPHPNGFRDRLLRPERSPACQLRRVEGVQLCPGHCPFPAATRAGQV